MHGTLSFGKFHAQHFSAAQTEQWRRILASQAFPHYDQIYAGYNLYYNPYNQYYAAQQSSYDPNDYYAYNGEEQEYYEQGNEQEEQHDQEQEEHQHQKEGMLSKEAIEIFQFSEAYRKEREGERLSEKSVELGDELIVPHHRNGIEASSTQLVLTEPDRKPETERIRIMEHALNAAFLENCRPTDNEPIVLWPVIPLNL